jgi:hypothetical protein
MGDRLPNFVIAGVMKSGTTALARYLEPHPEIFMSATLEIGFFHTDVAYARGVAWYRQFFAAATDEPAVGEATPFYLYSPEFADRLADTLPDARVVAILRDPVTRAYSHYLHWRDRTVREKRTFADAVAAELSTDLETYRVDDDSAPYFGYLARGHYLSQLKRVAGRIGRDRLLVVITEELESDPVGTYRTICRFLGIDDGFVPNLLGERINPYRAIHPRWLFDLILRYRLASRLPAPVARRLLKPLTRVGGAEPIEPIVKERLAEHFAPFNAALATWLGRDLDAWSRPKPRVAADRIPSSDLLAARARRAGATVK